MRVAVIGGAGYIGSHVALALAEAGHKPIAYDNLATGKREHLAASGTELVVGDIRDRKAVTAFLREKRIEAVVHLAALKSVAASMRDPIAYSDTNVAGTLTLLTAMHECGVKRIVFSSSASVYGTPEALPIDETHPLKPESYYGQTKAWIEGMLTWYAQLLDMRAASLRYFNAVGCDPEGRIVVREPQPENLFPIVLEAAAGERDKVTIFGDDYDTEDGTCVRDYVHVTDLADAHVRAIEHLEDHAGHHIFNLGTGSGLSVRECVDAALELFGEFPVEIGPRRPGDPAASYADASLAERVLGWTPRIVDLKEILRSMAPAFGLEAKR